MMSARVARSARIAWVGVVGLVGCSSPPSPPSPTALSDEAPAPAPACAGPAAGGDARLIVHYPVGARRLTAKVDSDPPCVERSFVNVGTDAWELRVADPAKVTPRLDGAPARGPAWSVTPGRTVDAYPHFTTTRGRVDHEWRSLRSTVYPARDGEPRRIEVYTPPSYDENTLARYPVLYMTDAQLAFRSSFFVNVVFGDQRVDDALDAGAESGAIAEAIVVGIDCPINPPPLPEADRLLELTPTSAVDPSGQTDRSGDAPKFLDMIVDELKPLVDAELRTLPGRQSTFLGGASAGGLFAVYVGVTRGDVFGGILAQSSAVWWDDAHMVRTIEGATRGPTWTAKVYADIGTGEASGGDAGPDDLGARHLRSNLELFEAYAGAGYVEGATLKTVVAEGATHHGDAWQRRIPAALAFLLGPRR